MPGPFLFCVGRCCRERLDHIWLESVLVAWSCLMPRSDRSPSIVPPGNDQDVYLVLDDFGGRIGQAWRGTNADATRLETVVADLLTASIAIRFASLGSIRRKAGRGTAPNTVPLCCAHAAP